MAIREGLAEPLGGNQGSLGFSMEQKSDACFGKGQAGAYLSKHGCYLSASCGRQICICDTHKASSLR